MRTICICTQNQDVRYSYKVTLDSSVNPYVWINDHIQASEYQNYSTLVWTSNEEIDAGTEHHVFLNKIVSIDIK